MANSNTENNESQNIEKKHHQHNDLQLLHAKINELQCKLNEKTKENTYLVDQIKAQQKFIKQQTIQFNDYTQETNRKISHLQQNIINLQNKNNSIENDYKELQIMHKNKLRDYNIEICNFIDNMTPQAPNIQGEKNMDDRKNNSWNCNYCTYLNNNSTKICDICGNNCNINEYNINTYNIENEHNKNIKNTKIKYLKSIEKSKYGKIKNIIKWKYIGRDGGLHEIILKHNIFGKNGKRVILVDGMMRYNEKSNEMCFLIDNKRDFIKINIVRMSKDKFDYCLSVDN